MGFWDSFGLAFVNLIGLKPLLIITAGVIIGILAGAMPGISPSTAVALLVPFSYTLNATDALILLCAIYLATNYGGSITAVLINTPGTPAAAATCFDGYPLAQKGEAGKGLGTALVASTVGGAFGILILIAFCVPLARVALKFSPAAYFAIALFGLSTVASMTSDNVVKSMVAVVFGLLINNIGVDPMSGVFRFTFGVDVLFDGFAIIPALIGMFALSVVFEKFEKWTGLDRTLDSIDNKLPSIEDFIRIKWTILRSSILGTFIGIFPGAGSTIASFISYDIEKRTSKNPELYGTGLIEGVAASEAANSSSVGGALVPLLALGIPGSATDAVLLGAFMLHDLVPGPLLFRDHPEVVYGIFASLCLANIVMLLIGLYGNRLFIKMVSVSDHVLYTFIFVVAMIGSFSVNSSVFDMAACIGFGIVGWLLKRYGYPVAPVVLGMVLGKMIEENFRRGVIMGGYSVFYTDKLAFWCLVVAVFSFCYPLLKAGWKMIRKRSAV